MLGAAVVVVAIVLILRSDVGPPPIVRGVMAPEFELPRLDATDASLALSSFSGRVVLVNFWASWCEPCEREMPAMERLYNALPRDRYRLSFPILLDLDQTTYASYQTMGVPESILVDQEGRIVERYVGPREWDAAEYEDRIRELIGATRRVPEASAF